jgi:hypothetical protein
MHALIRVSDHDLCVPLLKYEKLKPLINTVNLSHETPLLLAFKLNQKSPILADLIKHGAETCIPDKKGNLYHSTY